MNLEQEILGYKFTVEYYHPKLHQYIVLCHTKTEDEAIREKEHYERMWTDSHARVVPYKEKRGKKR